jgi:methyl-accepting chemotaxis protein
LFDTFYIPIPDTSPQQYRTQYDKYCDQTIRRIIDFYLEKDKRLIFVAPVDRNGYLPTHNSRFSQPLSGDPEIDAKKNRTKRMFNDRTGLAAARNTTDCLLQQYQRDTGETLYDLSLPIFIHKQHWGAIRVGYRK